MQILNGKLKGKKLSNCKTKSIRPAMGLVRKSIFDTLKDFVVGSDVLDLCAGTGVIGIEALSRGAKSLVLVDSSILAVKLIKKNLALCNTKAIVLHAQLPDVLRRRFFKDKAFDLVFIDPPYGRGKFIGETLNKLMINQLLNKNGFVLIESEAKSDFTIPDSLELHKEKLFGNTKLTILRST